MSGCGGGAAPAITSDWTGAAALFQPPRHRNIDSWRGRRWLLQPPRRRSIRTGAVSVEIVSAVNHRRGGSISGKIANVSVKKWKGRFEKYHHMNIIVRGGTSTVPITYIPTFLFKLYIKKSRGRGFHTAFTLPCTTTHTHFFCFTHFFSFTYYVIECNLLST